MDKLKIKAEAEAEVEAYIKIQIPTVPRKQNKVVSAKSKSPTIVHKESKTIIVSEIQK